MTFWTYFYKISDYNGYNIVHWFISKFYPFYKNCILFNLFKFILKKSLQSVLTLQDIILCMGTVLLNAFCCNKFIADVVSKKE